MIEEILDELSRGDKRLEWYEVQVEGYYNPGWFSWLAGWEITQLPNGNTRLAGPLIDQSALHGLFAQMRDMNVKIVYLNKMGDHQEILP
jgi:hypothetical protein